MITRGDRRRTLLRVTLGVSGEVFQGGSDRGQVNRVQVVE
jgi:hypothetical protein